MSQILVHILIEEGDGSREVAADNLSRSLRDDLSNLDSEVLPLEEPAADFFESVRYDFDEGRLNGIDARRMFILIVKINIHYTSDHGNKKIEQTIRKWVQRNKRNKIRAVVIEFPNTLVIEVKGISSNRWGLMRQLEKIRGRNDIGNTMDLMRQLEKISGRNDISRSGERKEITFIESPEVRIIPNEDGNVIDVDVDHLQSGNFYRVNYLGDNYAVEKRPDGKLAFYEVLD